MKSRDRIINAAIPVFARKGRNGAHMEEIAASAHINKAMIYYIFHNKDELYFEVLKFVLGKAWESMDPFTSPEIKGNKGFKEGLSDFITSQIEFFFRNRDYTKILVDAMSNGAEEIPRAVQHLKITHSEYDGTAKLKLFIEEGKRAKVIRDVDTDQLIISMIGMVLVYFLSHSINISLDIEIRDEARFMKIRRDSIIDLVMNGIMTDKSKPGRK